MYNFDGNGASGIVTNANATRFLRIEAHTFNCRTGLISLAPSYGDCRIDVANFGGVNGFTLPPTGSIANSDIFATSSGAVTNPATVNIRV